MLPDEYTGLMTNIMTRQLRIPSRQVCQEKSWKVGLLNTKKHHVSQILDSTPTFTIYGYTIVLALCQHLNIISQDFLKVTDTINPSFNLKFGADAHSKAKQARSTAA